MRTARLAVVALLALTVSALAQDGWRMPPEPMARIANTPPAPWLSVAPTGRHALVVQGRAMPALAEVARPMLPLAGYRFDPGNNGRHLPSTYATLALSDLAGGELPIALPDDAHVGAPLWSPDGQRFAFVQVLDGRLDLWVGDVLTASARRLDVPALNDVLGGAVRWMPDSHTLLCRFVPEGRGDAPERSRTPAGPVAQESGGTVAQVRTYQDLLGDEHDAALFDHYARALPAFVDSRDGKWIAAGPVAVWADLDPSPDGRWLLAERIERPYSYQVPASRFPRVVELLPTNALARAAARWSGMEDVEPGEPSRQLARRGVADTIPIGGVVTGPRNHGWHPNRDATLLWTEALDGGDPKVDVPQRDELFALDVAVDGAAPRSMYRTEHRFSGFQTPHNASVAFVSEYDRDRRWTRTWALEFDFSGGAEALASPPRLVFDRSVNDRYGDPGRFLTFTNPRGQRSIVGDGGRVWLSAPGASPEGDRPVLRQLDLTTLQLLDRWQCAPETYESVSALLPGGRLLTQFESKTVPPHSRVIDLEGDAPMLALTEPVDPAPELAGVQKELITYAREDGVPLSATLYLPPDHEPGQRHPLLVWAYPREYNDPATAGQVRGSEHRFTRLRGPSHLYMLLQGWAVLDGASMPVVGDPETMNETFVEQIVAAAQAAIDVADARGVIDPDRVAVGGHSYGAFMTANLLAHSDLFRAGIARSGAYNRSLTPFGFQSERRTLWEATDTYVKVSPFFHADAIDEPMLMIHGEKDNNSGTFPIQSERLFHAMRGHGGTARLVMLPHESHGYRARESVLQVLAEQAEWLERHVGPREAMP